MQVPTLVLAVAIEIYLALLIATVVLIIYASKQKKLIRRQQEKLRELIETIKTTNSPSATEGKSYKQLIYEQLELTQDRFALIAPRSDISEAQPSNLPINQRIVALRYAFLRAEELGTTEVPGSEGYWNVFRQTLEPLLQTDNNTELDVSLDASSEELDMYKKRVENLEKFKKLFFDLEKRWNEAQTNAQGYYNELYAMADGIEDRERYEMLLEQYGNSYNEITHYMHSTNAAITGQPVESKTINIIRQDPRAAEEIMKLRNVAADQYRVISNLQRKLEDAQTTEEKDLVIKELEQQLQRQVRFVQESDTCVQLLEDELNKAHEQIAKQGEQIEHDHLLEEENQRIKETLQSFTHESKELLGNLEDLERENDQLKNNLEDTDATPTEPNANLQQIQTEFAELRKQYTELEEKYLELKFK
ncbi:hypothetical protein [Cellvibrio sp. OA-2007]|uniref:hypothetical protein n=1 Tax=Cellvibrio sp. OA-2007 TaxID=529823 RepID=UPI00078338DB|nr:hypothetical protein [Cellvibrio sp. OA-2007]